MAHPVTSSEGTELRVEDLYDCNDREASGLLAYLLDDRCTIYVPGVFSCGVVLSLANVGINSVELSLS